MAKQTETTNTVKLTEEEIQKFQQASETINAVSSELGAIEININNLSARKEQLLNQYTETLQAQRLHSELLVQKYGQGNINTDTWEFTPSE